MDPSYIQTLQTIVLLLIYIAVRIIFRKVILNYSNKLTIVMERKKLILKYITFLWTLIVLFILSLIWGIDKKEILIVTSSVFAVIGIALFAQWSLLSNITSGAILFFFYPLRVGNRIKLLDKDYPIEAHVKEIKAFYVHLITDEGEHIVYPNNLLLQKGMSIMREVNP